MPTGAWEEYRRAQKNRRADRVPKHRDEVLALKSSGYDVQELSPCHFRIDGKLDLLLVHRTFVYLPTNARGSYIKAKECAAQWLRRRVKPE